MPIPYTTGTGGGNASLAAAIARQQVQSRTPPPAQSSFTQGTITPSLLLLPICASGTVTAPADGFFVISAAVNFVSVGIANTDHVNCSFGLSNTFGSYLHNFNVTLTNILSSEVGTYENGAIFLRLPVTAGLGYNIRLLCQLANSPSAGTISVSGDLMVQFSAA